MGFFFPFPGRHSLKFAGLRTTHHAVSRSLRWPRSFPRHHRSIPRPVNRGLGGAVSVWNFQKVFNQLCTFLFGAKLQIWGDNFFWGGLESYNGASVGCWVILRMSRNAADQFFVQTSLDLGLLPPQKILAVWWLFEGFTVIFSVCYFSFSFLGIYLNALLPDIDSQMDPDGFSRQNFNL